MKLRAPAYWSRRRCVKQTDISSRSGYVNFGRRGLLAGDCVRHGDRDGECSALCVRVAKGDLAGASATRAILVGEAVAVRGVEAQEVSALHRRDKQDGVTRRCGGATGFER